MERCDVGAGGVAVRSSETVALPVLQFAVQPPPRGPLHDVSTSEERMRSAAVNELRIMEYPVIEKCPYAVPPGAAKPSDNP